MKQQAHISSIHFLSVHYTPAYLKPHMLRYVPFLLSESSTEREKVGSCSGRMQVEKA